MMQPCFIFKAVDCPQAEYYKIGTNPPNLSSFQNQPMKRGSENRRQDVDFPCPHRSLLGGQGGYRCPHCFKAYKTPTWLENHIKAKHTTSMTQDQSEILAHTSNSYQNSVSNTMLLFQSFRESH